MSGKPFRLPPMTTRELAWRMLATKCEDVLEALVENPQAHVSPATLHDIAKVALEEIRARRAAGLVGPRIIVSKVDHLRPPP
jgi:hypothetical protein